MEKTIVTAAVTFQIKDILERVGSLYIAGADYGSLRQLEDQLSSILSSISPYIPEITKSKDIYDQTLAELARERQRRGRINLVPYVAAPFDKDNKNPYGSLSLEALVEIAGCLTQEAVQNWARANARDPLQVLEELRENPSVVQTPDGFKPVTLWLAGRRVSEVLDEIAAWPEELARAAAQRLDTLRPQPLPFDEAEIELSDPSVSPNVQVEFLRSLVEGYRRKRKVLFDKKKNKILLYKSARRFLSAEWETPSVSPDRIFNLACGYTRRPSASPDELELIQQKIEKLNKLFREFLEKNPIIKQEVEEAYQKLFGQFLAPPVSDAPLPFENENLRLWPHQRRGARRIATSPKTLIFYPTGAGKTLTALAGAALLKLRRHPAPARTLVVSPANVLTQWETEAKKLGLKPLVIEQGTPPAAALAKIIASGAEVVLLAPSTFSLLPCARPMTSCALQQEVENIANVIQCLSNDLQNILKNSGASKSAKSARIQKVLQDQQDLLQNKRNALLDLERENLAPIRLDLIPFDLVIIDEVHLFKGYADPRRISSGTQLAVRVAERIAALNNANPNLKTVAMTATPVLNRPEELFSLIEFLQPELLHAAQLSNPDEFVARFARTETCWETAPTGGWRDRARVVGWRRRSELCRLLAPILDAVSPEELAACTTVPEFAANQLVTVDPSPLFEDFCERLIERVEKIEKGQVSSTQDNMLLVTTDARRAALHVRMVDPTADPDDPTNAPKVEALAKNAAQIKRLSQHGCGLQLVFCDTRFANDQQTKSCFDLYEYIKTRLVANGFLPSEIAFAEAGNKKLLEEIKRRANCGTLRVVIGSTQTLGSGLNIQKHLVAIHHLDAPWRPADVDQRLGRMVRTGNQWKRTHSFIYVLRRSFDAYVWQILERKARTINELLSTTKTLSHESSLEWREDLALTAAEARAAASGNPYTAAYLCVLTEQERALRQAAFHSARAVSRKISDHVGLLSNTLQARTTLNEILEWQQLLQKLAAKLVNYGNQPLASLPEAVLTNFSKNLHPLVPYKGQRLVLAIFSIEENSVALVVESALSGDTAFYFIDNSLQERLRFTQLPVRAATLAQYIQRELAPRLEDRRQAVEALCVVQDKEEEERKEAHRRALQAVARAAAAAEVAQSLIPHLNSQGFHQFPTPCTVQLPAELIEKQNSILDQQRAEVQALAQQIVAQWSAPQLSQTIQLCEEDFVLVESAQTPQQPAVADHLDPAAHAAPQTHTHTPQPEKRLESTRIADFKKPTRATRSKPHAPQNQLSLF